MKTFLCIVGILLLGVIGVLGFVLYDNAPYISFGQPKPVSSSSVIVQSVEVSQKAIVLHVGSVASAGLFSGYRTQYEQGSLYVSFMPIILGGGSDTFTIPNTYGKIDVVYLRGVAGEPDLEIWPKNTTQYDGPTSTTTSPVSTQ